MRAVPPPADSERPSLRRVVEGLRYARSRPELIGTYLIDMAAMFFGMPMALFPALAVRYGGAAGPGGALPPPPAGAPPSPPPPRRCGRGGRPRRGHPPPPPPRGAAR